jgi:hypothetical protein
MASTLMKPLVTVADSHCCSCQVLDDIMAICQTEAIPSVNNPSCKKSGLADYMQVEQSLLVKYLSDLEAYRGTHAGRAYSTLGLVNVLLDFVRRTYRSSTDHCSTLSVASQNGPGLPPGTASNKLLTTLQPGTKIVEHFGSKLGKAHRSGEYTAISDATNFRDEAGWEPIVFERDNTDSDAAFSETSPEDTSSGTSFESGSEVMEASPPATRLSSPVISALVILRGNGEREVVTS